MKVLYDHQVFEFQNIGGISRYFMELIKHNPAAQLSLKYSDNIYLNDEFFRKYNLLSKDYEYVKFLPHYNFRGKRRLFRYYNKFILGNRTNIELSKEAVNISDFEIFHPTYYNPYFLRYLNGRPFVLTVHDMIHEMFPDYFPGSDTSKNKKKLIHKAKEIIAVSKTTKNDLLRFYPDIEHKVKIVYHGFFSGKIITEFKTKENYLLFTGSRGGYKNFNVFIESIALLLKKYDLRLICTGQPFDKKEIALLEYFNISDRVACCFVSDEELITLYAKAIAFIFPSLYEGFGIPVLESFAAGCPAILSNVSSLPEIGGHGAAYFDPYSVDDIRSVIEKVITSENLQKTLIKNGRERIKKFSWEKCVKETMDVYYMAMS
ncbi:MAG: glycosyltransferase family 4 protein [Bacteroidales bacterium]|jgi:glycosyltransferase involved in cell wall biosynthesis|nr:glycosyltransferase family 4 protein [Bacteroidales bacterium]